MTDEQQDEMLGRALSRAIETQQVHETLYERSRVALRPARRGFPIWQALGAAAVLVLAVAYGAWFSRPRETPGVASSPTPTATAAAIATQSSAETTSPQSAVPQYEPVWAYFTRDGLPPIGAAISAHVTVSATGADQRINERLMALAFDAKQSDWPAGTIDPLAYVAGTTSGSGGGLGITVRVNGDLATLDFQLANGWGVHGALMAQLLVQQIVYTATEEPGVRRVLITEQNKTGAVIDGLVLDKPLSRDDVSGYGTRAQTGTTNFDGDASSQYVTGDLVSRDIVDGTSVRLTFVGSDRAHNAAKADLPPFSITFGANDGTVPHNRNDGPPPSYVLSIGFHVNAQGEFGAVGHVERVDRSPLRLMTSTDAAYVLGLDDARPWRAYEPDAQHLVVEIGGDPRAVSDRIAVNSPSPATTIDSRTFTLSGAARTFEANVVWRLKDSTQKVVANGHTTASLGTSALWGTFSTPVTLPTGVSGNMTLEVYEVSPKDGSEQGVVAIPLLVR